MDQARHLPIEGWEQELPGLYRIPSYFFYINIFFFQIPNLKTG